MKFLFATAAVALLIGSGAGMAETVKINAGQQGDRPMQTPSRGMTKQSVQQKFGDPQDRYAPVGDPPIARWVFDGYTVYFEYDKVIHTVAHHYSSK